MKLINNGLFYMAIVLVILSCFTDETEARRKVLRGRRTVTRRDYRPLAIPAWAIIVICGIGNLILGGILYLVMRWVVLSKSSEPSSTYIPANMNEA